MIALIFAALGAPVTLERVLESVESHVPAVAMADAKIREAEAKLLSKRGAFDPKLKAKGGVYLLDYPRELADVQLSTNTLFGPQVEAGWRTGAGDFPSYDGRATGEGGEVYAQVTLPLLDGLGNPEVRAQLQVARHGVGIAQASRDNKLRLLRQKATETWAKWVASSEKEQVSRQVFAQTQDRQHALDRQVQEGTRARLDQLDNLRALKERQAELAQATNARTQSAIALSLFLRDPSGDPVVPSQDQLPKLRIQPPTHRTDPAEELAQTRPDGRWSERQIHASQTLERRQKNAALPDLSITARGTKPLDSEKRSELYFGATLELGTLLRKERGARAAATAARQRTEQQRRAILDRAAAEIQAARASVRLAWDQVIAAREAEAHAQEVVRLTQRHFQLGGTDLFKLLARETKALKVTKSRVDAELRYRIALAQRASAEGP